MTETSPHAGGGTPPGALSEESHPPSAAAAASAPAAPEGSELKRAANDSGGSPAGAAAAAAAAPKRQRVMEVSGGDIAHAATHPKFLHSNSTSHQWAFGAIAELIDNAADPDVAAKRLQITAESMPDGKPALIITDDGNGLDLGGLQKLLSFGYNDKAERFKGTIGRYGNGFKSGSMRLGKDAMVFTKHGAGDTMSAGLLSQSFLAKVGAEEVLIPMVSWNKHTQERVSDHAERNIKLLCEHSPLSTENAMKLMLGRLDADKGTIIVIYNLREQDDGQLELDFESDSHDIRLRGVGAKFQRSRSNQPAETDVPIDYSLREYCRILYLEPRMQIELRFQKIRTKRILKTTTQRKTVKYTPNTGRPEGYSITFGFQPSEEEHLYGVMLYHHNRLIIPYYRVGVQLQPNKDGLGVMGVLEADFLDPTHNKQDFDDNSSWRRLLMSLAEKINMFWYENEAERQQDEAMQPEQRPLQRKRKKAPVSTAKMNALLAQLWRDENSTEFHELPNRRQYPDYYLQVKKPIALEQIKVKVSSAQYRTIDEMQKDVRLMCDNARSYNQQGSAVYINAAKLEKIMVDFVRQMGSDGGASAASAISVDEVPSEQDMAAEEGGGRPEEQHADNWVQCDNENCQKWRKLPFGASLGDTDADWFCHMNPDDRYNSCEIPEHKEEEVTSRQNSMYREDPKKKLEREQRKQAEREAGEARERENQQLREQLAEAERQRAAPAAAGQHYVKAEPGLGGAQAPAAQPGQMQQPATAGAPAPAPAPPPAQNALGEAQAGAGVDAFRFNLPPPAPGAMGAAEPAAAYQAAITYQQQMMMAQQQAAAAAAGNSSDQNAIRYAERLARNGMGPFGGGPPQQLQQQPQAIGMAQPQAAAYQVPVNEQEQMNDDIELVCETLAGIAARLKTRSVLTQVQAFLDTLAPAGDEEPPAAAGDTTLAAAAVARTQAGGASDI